MMPGCGLSWPVLEGACPRTALAPAGQGCLCCRDIPDADAPPSPCIGPSGPAIFPALPRGPGQVSEFSSSFHIRTTSPTDTEQRLRKAKLSGLVFGPKNDWLTFVPYPDTDGIAGSHDDAAMASAIATTTGETVLCFQFAEDHGWSVAMVKPGQFLGIFSCAWDHEPIAVHDNLDRQALEEIVHAPGVERFLRDTEPSANKTPLAFGFAKAIGLPAYRWLSPRYIEQDTQHYVDAGARKIGRKPAPAPTTALPSPVKLELPKTDLTARETLALLAPIRGGAVRHGPCEW